MSDYLFSSQPQSSGTLAASLSMIYLNDSDEVACSEFHGKWGSLAVTASRYHGFQPVETESHICVVIGGPVLYFQDNNFIAGDDSQAGTRAVLSHWQAGKADWSEDLSGPFTILVIDKQSAQVQCITDMMMFIPVYQNNGEDYLFWGTHTDALARVCEEEGAFDEASLVDFILHHLVTYPYTTYQNIRQCQPGSVHYWGGRERATGIQPQAEYYWQPLELNPHGSLGEAATYLRKGVQGYIDRVTGSLSHVAQFISAGEDSRVLAGMLPQELERDAYIFLDNMNREGRIAKRVAQTYGAHFKPDYRSQTHYLDILPEASDLVGSGHQYHHAHPLGFDRTHHLSAYRAVFGGYIADALLKSLLAKKPRLIKKLPFLPEVSTKGERRTKQVSNSLFSTEVLGEITRRRCEYFSQLEVIRPLSAHEWFELWPITMNAAVPNFHSNRRLFASYEVFMTKECVKVAASIPVRWKLNRRLFNQAFRPALKKTQFVFHGDGRLPYYPWWVNSPLQFSAWLMKKLSKVAQSAGVEQKNQGPWADWRKILNTPNWEESVVRCEDKKLPHELANVLKVGALRSKGLSISRKVNFMQVCYLVSGLNDKNDN